MASDRISPEAQQLRDSLEGYLRVLISTPDGLEIDVAEGTRTLFLAVYVAEEDIPRAVGRNRSTLKAMQTLWGKAAMRIGRWKRFELDLPQATG